MQKYKHAGQRLLLKRGKNEKKKNKLNGRENSQDIGIDGRLMLSCLCV
jgi:hypothetical protein